MKILEINASNFGSTGNIMLNIKKNLDNNGHETIIAIPKSRSNLKKSKENDILIGTIFSRNCHLLANMLTGCNGCFSVFSTLLFLRKVKNESPDIIQLHNLHNCYINLPLLFRFIKKYKFPTIWTLHDCWSFTGQCAHFTAANCNRWKFGCGKCTQYKNYPEAYVDRTKKMWKLKKRWFSNIENMTIVTPSKWLANCVDESFLSKYPIKVIYNGVDLKIFKPTENDFRKKYSIIASKKIILGVAHGWSERKGIDTFIELSKQLDKNRYQIVLVGIDNETAKKLPENIIALNRTETATELAEIYTAADLFVNPTREEVLGMVNIEANACGTPVLAFRTGGCPECITEDSGVIVDCDDMMALEKEIIRICETSPYSQENCVKSAARFEMSRKYYEYIALYEKQLIKVL